jgi:hypothetical protein
MDSKEFQNQLNEAHDLMTHENYKDAIILLEKLKEDEKQSNFDYSLTHQLFQLLSNAHSLYNQERIKNGVNSILMKQKTMTFTELNQLLKERTGLDLDDNTFQKELEILILRGLLSCSIEGKNVIF